MSTETDWSLDYCLYCDKQTLGGLYCSQACRLADLESPTASINLCSNKTRSSSHPTSVSIMPFNDFNFSTRSPSYFHLPPAYNFDEHRTRSKVSDSPPQSPLTSSHSSQRPTLSHTVPQYRNLNTSSSRSSLASFISTGSNPPSQHSLETQRDWKFRTGTNN